MKIFKVRSRKIHEAWQYPERRPELKDTPAWVYMDISWNRHYSGLRGKWLVISDEWEDPEMLSPQEFKEQYEFVEEK